MNDKTIVKVVNNKTNDVIVIYNVTIVNILNNKLYVVTSKGNTFQFSIDNNSFAIYNN